MRRFLTLMGIFFISSHGLLTAQTRNDWSIDITPVIFQSQENILHGKRFSSLGIYIRPCWELRTEKMIHAAFFEVGFAEPKTSLEPVRASAWAGIRGEYTLVAKLFKGKYGTLYAGGTAGARYYLEFLPMWDESHLFWTTFIGVGPIIQWEKTVREKNRLYLQFDFPLFGWLSRPPAYWESKMVDSSIGNLIKTVNADLHVVTINQYWNSSFEVGYILKHSKGFSFGFLYRFEYLYAKKNDSSPYKQLIQGLGLQFIF